MHFDFQKTLQPGANQEHVGGKNKPRVRKGHVGLSASKRLEKEVIFFQHYNSHSSQIINVGFLHNDASNKLIKTIFNNETRNYSLMSEGKWLSVKSVSALVIFVLFKACPFHYFKYSKSTNDY